MKRNVISIFVVAAIAIVAGWNVMQSQSEKVLSDVALANVEALAWEYPTITCISICQWDPNYNCAVYVQDSYGVYHYEETCSEYKG
jgi:hypothetical protein